MSEELQNYYEWAALLQSEFRKIQQRMHALEEKELAAHATIERLVAQVEEQRKKLAELHDAPQPRDTPPPPSDTPPPPIERNAIEPRDALEIRLAKLKQSV